MQIPTRPAFPGLLCLRSARSAIQGMVLVTGNGTDVSTILAQGGDGRGGSGPRQRRGTFATHACDLAGHVDLSTFDIVPDVESLGIISRASKPSGPRARAERGLTRRTGCGANAPVERGSGLNGFAEPRVRHRKEEEIGGFLAPGTAREVRSGQVAGLG